MYSWVRARVLGLMRLPPDPAPPTGAPGSVRTFRAAPGFYYLSLIRWAVGQTGALIGIVVSLSFLWSLEKQTAAVTAAREAREAREAEQAEVAAGGAVAAEEPARPARGERRRERPSVSQLARTLEPQAWWVFPLIRLGEGIGILVYLVQLVATGVGVRLEYELRWYIVTDRSLRIRAGVWKVQESTMSFANLQQVTVTQGPVQRLLGLADVQVQSAGGGGTGRDEKGQAHDSLHTGTFHGVANAPEIRDLILARLRAFREAGLGDPDDASAPGADASSASPGDPAAAARELLAAARELRRTLVERRPG